MGDSLNLNSVGVWRSLQATSSSSANMKSTSPSTSSPSSTSSSAQSKVANAMGKALPLNPTAHAATTPLTVRIKRGHVSKACTNCRKMHAACDRARPCSRCVFNKLESSCVDIPRKKRVSRKKPHSPEDSNNSPLQGNSLSAQDTPKKDRSPVGWNSDIFIDQPTQKNMDDNNSSSSSSSQMIISGNNNINNRLLPMDEPSIVSASTPDMWTESSFLSPEPLFLSELLAEEEKRIYSTSSSNSSNSLSSMIPSRSSSLKHDPTDSSKQSYEISYLLQEVERLKDINNDLTSKLMGVTEELGDVKMKTQSLMQLIGSHILIPRENVLSSSSIGGNPPP